MLGEKRTGNCSRRWFPVKYFKIKKKNVPLITQKSLPIKTSAQDWALLGPNSNMHVCIVGYVQVWVPHECLLSSTAFANVPSQQKSSKALSLALFAVQDYNHNDVWQWKLLKIPHHFEGLRGPRGPQSLYKTFILPFNCTSWQRRRNNKYPRLHHLGHRSTLNQVLLPPPLLSIM